MVYLALWLRKYSAVTLTQGVVTLNHINVERKVKGKSTWQWCYNDIIWPNYTIRCSSNVMEWVRLHHESVTGRDGYSDFYKKDLTIKCFRTCRWYCFRMDIKRCIYY